MMLTFLNPVESSSDLIFISILFEMDRAMLPVSPWLTPLPNKAP